MTRNSVGKFIGLLPVLAPVVVAAQQRVMLPARDRLLTERPAQVYSVGEEDGESWELLSGVRSVAFDARDNLYVLDGNNFRVLVFDANGRYVRQVSKKGEGPGELMAPLSMTVTTDGLIVVGDLGRRAYSLFKTDGTFLRNALFPEGEMAGLGPGSLDAHPRNGVVSRTGGMFARLDDRLRGRGAGPVPSQISTGERKSQVKWWDFTATPTRSRTADEADVPADAIRTARLYEFTEPPINARVEDRGSGGGREAVSVMVRATVWQPQISFGVLPTGGIAFMHEKEYRVKVASAAGAVERIIERAIAPRKGTDRDKRMALERQREGMRTGSANMIAIERREGAGGGRSGVSIGAPPGSNANAPSIDEMLKTASFEEFIPVLRRIETDPQGRIWIARTPADFGTNGPIDIVRSDGRYIGSLASGRLPDAVSRSGRAAYVERDDLGVERVVVRRLPATWQ